MRSIRQPYPGLRSFRREEADLFFGRDSSTDKMINILGERRFLAVLGPSGSGKSSLVRTGLFEAVRLGFLHHPNPSCWIVETRPARSPMRRLAESLLRKQRNLSPQETLPENDIEDLAEHLDHGPRSLTLWAAEGNVPQDTSLLLLVDQFEELFRYSNYDELEEAESFVGILLESAASNLFPIYIVITMRSEFLGACSSIDQLAERISQSLYLTPRMERESCRAAIEGPTGVIRFRIEPALVNRMLNDLAAFLPRTEDTNNDYADQLALQSDQLPLMQHALNQLWLKARQRSEVDVELQTTDYEVLGGMAGAINQHCDSLVQQVARDVAGGALLVQTIFRALVEGSSIATAVRRPQPFGHLVALAGDRRDDVATIIRTFRDEPNFLYTSKPALDDDTDVVITHESLIRQWKELRRWLEVEILDGSQWQRLLDRYHRQEMPSGATLQHFVDWWEKTTPNTVWATRYGGEYDSIVKFLKDSTREDRRRRNRRRFTVSGVTALIVGLALFTYYQAHSMGKKAAIAKQAADNAKRDADNAKRDADNAKRDAVKLGEKAAAEAKAARIQEERADLAAASLSTTDPIHQLFWLGKTADVELGKESTLPPAPALQDMEVDSDLDRHLAEAVVSLNGQQPLYAASRVHKLNIEQVLYTNGTSLIITRDGQAIAIWNSASRTLVKKVDGLGEIYSAAVSSDGHVLFVSTESSGGLLYSLPSGKILGTIDTNSAKARVMDSTFSINSDWLATGDQAGDIRVWRVSDCLQASKAVKPYRILTSPDSDRAIVMKLTFVGTSDFPRIVAEEIALNENEGSRASTARYWDVKQSKSLETKKIDGYLLSISCTANKWCALVGSRNITLWDPNRDVEIKLPDQARVDDAVFSRNGKWLVTSQKTNVTRYDTQTWQPTRLHAHSAQINSISFSDDDRYFATSSDDGSSVVWNLEEGLQVNRMISHGHVRAAIFHPENDDTVLTYSDDRTVTQWNLKDVAKPVAQIELGEAVNKTVFSPDDAVAAVMTKTKGILVDRASLTQTTVVDGPECRDVTFSNDGNYVAFACGNSVTVWDRRKQRKMPYPEPWNRTMLGVAFSPDSRMLVTWSEDHKATVWRASTGQIVGIPMTLAGTHIFDAQFDQSSTKLVLVGEAGTGSVFTLRDGTWVETEIQIRHRGKIFRAVFSHDGSRVITGGEDGYARIWSVTTGKKLNEIKCLYGLRDLKLSPNGAYLVTSGEEGSVQLWTKGGQPVKQLSGLAGRVYKTSFNASQTLLAAAGANGEIRVWNIPTGQLVMYIAERPEVNDIQFAHHSDRLLVISSSDERVSYWQVPSVKTREQLDNIAKQFTPDQDTQDAWIQELPTVSPSVRSSGSDNPAARPDQEPKANVIPDFQADGRSRKSSRTGVQEPKATVIRDFSTEKRFGKPSTSELPPADRPPN